MSGIYLLLGSNQGNRFKNIQIAKERLTGRSIIVKKESAFYETAAWGIEDQPSFYNQVIEVDQPYTPQKLMQIILEVEVEMGRVREEKWGERLIDIDILYFDDLTIEESNLIIPHAEITKRRFTLEPLVEIAQDFVHPVLGKSNKELLSNCADSLAVNKVEL